GRGEIREVGKLEEKSVGELAELLKSWNLLEASVGLASINSIIDPKGDREGSGLDLALEVGKGKRIVMIGKFPRIEEFKKVAREFVVLEINPYLVDPSNEVYLSTASEYFIPNADVVIITASAIINKSIDRLLELSRNAYTILVGPSTPMLDTLFEFGVDALAGIKVNNAQRLMKKIRQGLGMIDPKKLEGDLSFIIKFR
ncbi:hypothetical protein DJ522_05130, partial [Sulfolobus sp. F3]